MPDALTVAARANHVLVGVLILAGLAFAAIGAAQNDTFYLRLATEALIFGGLALSVDILLGYTGLLSLGQALYFGLGAYLSALVLKAVPSFWLALAAGLGAGLVLGLVGGIIAIRVRGVYFALITFGLAQVVAKVVYNTRALGASDGCWACRSSTSTSASLRYRARRRPASSWWCWPSSWVFTPCRPTSSTRRSAAC